jgi:hypothetical protein
MTSSYAQSNKLKFFWTNLVRPMLKGSCVVSLGTLSDMNPGTSINSEEVANKFDISIRRLRMGVSAQLTPNYMFIPCLVVI